MIGIEDVMLSDDGINTAKLDGIFYILILPEFFCSVYAVVD